METMENKISIQWNLPRQATCPLRLDFIDLTAIQLLISVYLGLGQPPDFMTNTLNM